MYFDSRAQTGELFIDLLKQLKPEKPVIVVLGDGGAEVALPLAEYLETEIYIYMTKNIHVPPPIGQDIGSIDLSGNITYDRHLAHMEIDNILSEYRGNVEQEKMVQMRILNQESGEGVLESTSVLKGRPIIIVADVLMSEHPLDSFQNFIKPIETGKIIAAVGIATVNVVDVLHILCDELHVLSVVEALMDGADHYFSNQEVAKHTDILKRINIQNSRK